MITEYSLLYMATASFHLAGLSTIFYYKDIESYKQKFKTFV